MPRSSLCPGKQTIPRPHTLGLAARKISTHFPCARRIRGILPLPPPPLLPPTSRVPWIRVVSRKPAAGTKGRFRRRIAIESRAAAFRRVANRAPGRLRNFGKVRARLSRRARCGRHRRRRNYAPRATRGRARRRRCATHRPFGSHFLVGSGPARKPLAAGALGGPRFLRGSMQRRARNEAAGAARGCTRNSSRWLIGRARARRKIRAQRETSGELAWAWNELPLMR